MRLLFDITHPAIVHMFKHAIAHLRSQGHDVLVTARDKDVTVDLIAALGVECECLSHPEQGFAGLSREWMGRTVRLHERIQAYRPDVLVSAASGMSIGLVGALRRVPRVVFDQIDARTLQSLMGLPFASVLGTGLGYRKDYGKRHKRFRGFLAQTYLHPCRFSPDPGILRQSGMDPEEPFIVLRTVAWTAVHDTGMRAASEEELAGAVENLSAFGTVWITSEHPLPASLGRHACPVPAQHLHHALAFARACVAEGGTVGVEAGILGVPSVCCTGYRFGYLDVLEREYGLIHRTRTLSQGVEAARSLLASADIGEKWKRRRARLFEETEDVHLAMVRIIESSWR